jgi:pentapeptide MXKDX repeat protein
MLRELSRQNFTTGDPKMALAKNAGWMCAATLALGFAFQTPTLAQDNMQDTMKQEDVKHDSMKSDKMQGDQMMHDEMSKALFTGKFQGKVHPTEGRATVYQEAGGKLILRLTNFKTSNGPDVHVVLVAIKDASENVKFFKNTTERIELGKMKGNEGDQNYEIPAGTDLKKFQTVSIYCVRFNANFGTAPLEKF